MSRFFLIVFFSSFCSFSASSSLLLDKENLDPNISRISFESFKDPKNSTQKKKRLRKRTRKFIKIAPAESAFSAENDPNYRSLKKHKRTSFYFEEGDGKPRKKKCPLTPKTKKRVKNLKSYGLGKKKTLEADWVHKSISRGDRGIPITSLSEIFKPWEIKKMYRQGVDLGNVFLNIQVLKESYPSPIKLLQGNFGDASRFLSPIEKLYDSRKNRKNYTTTKHGSLGFAVGAECCKVVDI